MSEVLNIFGLSIVCAADGSWIYEPTFWRNVEVKEDPTLDGGQWYLMSEDPGLQYRNPGRHIVIKE